MQSGTGAGMLMASCHIYHIYLFIVKYRFFIAMQTLIKFSSHSFFSSSIVAPRDDEDISLTSALSTLVCLKEYC